MNINHLYIMNEYKSFVYNEIKFLNPHLKKLLSIKELVQLYESNKIYYLKITDPKMYKSSIYKSFDM